MLALFPPGSPDPVGYYEQVVDAADGALPVLGVPLPADVGAGYRGRRAPPADRRRRRRPQGLVGRRLPAGAHARGVRRLALRGLAVAAPRRPDRSAPPAPSSPWPTSSRRWPSPPSAATPPPSARSPRRTGAPPVRPASRPCSPNAPASHPGPEWAELRHAGGAAYPRLQRDGPDDDRPALRPGLDRERAAERVRPGPHVVEPARRSPRRRPVPGAVVDDPEGELRRIDADLHVHARRHGVAGHVRQRLAEAQQQVGAGDSATALSIGPVMSHDGRKPSAGVASSHTATTSLRRLVPPGAAG